MILADIRKVPSDRKRRKRVGRGAGSGHGKTSGRGHKGQKARSGYRRKLYFEGGQMPLARRVPKRGFHNVFKKQFTIVNLRDLERFDGTEVITPELLLKTGVISKLSKDGVKILGQGEIHRAITVRANGFSKSAVAKIEACGGKAEVL